MQWDLSGVLKRILIREHISWNNKLDHRVAVRNRFFIVSTKAGKTGNVVLVSNYRRKSFIKVFGELTHATHPYKISQGVVNVPFAT